MDRPIYQRFSLLYVYEYVNIVYWNIFEGIYVKNMLVTVWGK